MKCVIILNGLNYPCYLRWDPDLPRMIEWTPIKASAYIYVSEEAAKADIESMGLDARIEFIESPQTGQYVIIDIRTMDFMKNKAGKLIFYASESEAIEVCGMYEFENAWVMRLVYNHIEPIPNNQTKRHG